MTLRDGLELRLQATSFLQSREGRGLSQTRITILQLDEEIMQFALTDQIVAAMEKELTLSHAEASAIFERACAVDRGTRQLMKSSRSRLHKHAKRRTSLSLTKSPRA